MAPRSIHSPPLLHPSTRRRPLRLLPVDGANVNVGVVGLSPRRWSHSLQIHTQGRASWVGRGSSLSFSEETPHCPPAWLRYGDASSAPSSLSFLVALRVRTPILCAPTRRHHHSASQCRRTVCLGKETCKSGRFVGATGPKRGERVPWPAGPRAPFKDLGLGRTSLPSSQVGRARVVMRTTRCFSPTHALVPRGSPSATLGPFSG